MHFNPASQATVQQLISQSVSSPFSLHLRRSTSSIISRLMEWSPAKVLILIAAVSGIIELTAAANHSVGSPGQWDLRTNLSQWASSTNFRAGDNLIFTYDRTSHNVLEVNRSSYDNCLSSGPIQTHSSGNDVIALPQRGTRYFICGFPTHCTLGMKIQVVTNAAAAPSPASPPNSPPPSSGSTPAPPPSGGSTPAPPPSGGSTPAPPTSGGTTPAPPTSGGSSLPPESGTSAGGPTPSPSVAGRRMLDGKAAAAGITIAVGMTAMLLTF